MKEKESKRYLAYPQTNINSYTAGSSAAQCCRDQKNRDRRVNQATKTS